MSDLFNTPTPVNQPVKVNDRNESVITIRLNKEQMKEMNDLGMDKNEYKAYILNKGANTSNLSGPVVENRPMEQQSKNSSTDLLKAMEDKFKAEKEAAELRVRLDMLNENLKSIKHDSLTSNQSLSGLVAAEVEKIEEKREKERLIKAEKDLTAELERVKEKLEQSEKDCEELFEKISMKEMALAAAPAASAFFLGLKRGGLEGALSGLASIGNLPDEVKAALPPAEANVVQLSDQDKDKIKFATMFEELFQTQEVKNHILEICGYLGSNPNEINAVVDFLNKRRDVSNSQTQNTAPDSNNDSSIYQS